VVGHETKCRFLHGHNYRIHFFAGADQLDSLGRVIDFGVIKAVLCEWLEKEWDHKFLIWEEDPFLHANTSHDEWGFKPVPFNPTAENMGIYLLNVICPELLNGTGVTVTKVIVEETRKCSAEVTL